MRDEESESNAFEQNLTDVFVPTQLDWRTYSEINVKPIEYTSQCINFIGFNHENALINDVDFRKVIAFEKPGFLKKEPGFFRAFVNKKSLCATDSTSRRCWIRRSRFALVWPVAHPIPRSLSTELSSLLVATTERAQRHAIRM